MDVQALDLTAAPAVAARATDADFVALVRIEHARLLRMVQAIVGDRDTAHDVVQEAFARLYQRWATVGHYEAPGACARRIAIRLAVRVNQRRWRRPQVEATYETTVTAGPRDLDLQRAVLALPPMQRVAVVLHYLEDRPVAEVAELIGCKEATAKVHLHRGRTRLAELLGSSSQTEESDR